ncbi:GyrI-like domain-containing protein [Legionella sp. D16C41]|uniref:GyrI-like domain-containing protein n=1 Tax=Legionella sp. D16C41 TaxID=3402688 RepID=UPI003AF6CD38
MLITKPYEQYVSNFTVIGFSVKTKNSDETNLNTAKIPNLWQQFYASNLANKVPTFGVYSDYESDTQGAYTITVGIAKNHQKQDYPKQVVINAGNYLVFKAIGPLPAVVISTWQYIWEYFTLHTSYQRNFKSDFEQCNGSNEIAIYIGIQ